MRKFLLVTLFILVAISGLIQNKDFYTTLLRDLTTELVLLLPKNPISEKLFPEIFFKEQFDAHIGMKPDTIVSITHGWIPYYHRHKNHKDINRVIHTLISNDTFEEKYIPFFAQLLNQHLDQFFRLEESAAALSNPDKDLVTNILQEALHWQPADFSLPIDHEKIWAEYSVTGSLEIVKKYSNYLDSEQYDLDDEVISQIQRTLIRAARTYYPVYEKLEVLKNRSSGIHQQHLLDIFTTVRNQTYQPSNDYWFTGDSHKKNKNYHKAKSTFMRGLMIAPDNPFLYRATGEVFLIQQKLDSALASLNYARQICPDGIEVSLLYRIAEIYRENHHYNRAIELYKEALLIEPENANTLTTLAWAYDQVHDLKNAEKYYRESLLHQPSHTLKDRALTFFKRNKLPPPETRESIEDLLMKRKFTGLEQIFSKALSEKKVNEDGVLEVYSMFKEVAHDADANTSSFTKYVDAHTEWIEQRPDSYVANACAGMFYLEYAWNARGSGYASTITKESWKQFHERLRLAARYLTKAYRIDPTHSSVPTKMITVAKVHRDLPASDVEKWFQRAIESNPSDCVPYISKSNFLSPMWGGSREEQFKFARETLKNSPKDSMAPVIFSKIHWAIYDQNSDANYFKRPEVWSELKEVQNKLIKRFPHSNVRHNWFAKSACFAGDFEIAQREFGAIGDNWIKGVWSSQEEFDYYRNLAFYGEREKGPN